MAGGVDGSFPKIRGPQYRPQNTIILILGTQERYPKISRNPPYGDCYRDPFFDFPRNRQQVNHEA